MRWLLLLLCGCNQAFGLSETAPSDARYFDAPPRGVSHCPAIGEDLAFSPVLHQLHLDCGDYDVSTTGDVAVAMCRDGDQVQAFGGPPGGPLVRIPEIPDNTPDFSVYSPGMDPDGTALVVSTFDLTNIVGELRVYHRDGSTWIRDANAPNPPPVTSNLSRGPEYRLLATNGTSDVTELAYSGGTWWTVRTHTLATLGVPSAGSIWLSADALRMLFVANNFAIEEDRYMAYADRASTADAFGPARPLGLPVVSDAYVTEDCGRIYFSGLHSIFYAENP